MPACVEPHPDGAVLMVWAAPGASRDRIVGPHGNALKVAVSAPADKGRANQRLCAVLASALAVPARDVVVLAGASHRDKRVLVRGRSVEELRTWLAQRWP